MSTILAEANDSDLQSRLKELAREIVSDLSELEPAQSKELLGDFVAELFLSQAKQSQQTERRQKQAKGIAAAKARGVRFGRPGAVVPENFEVYHQAWRNGEMTARAAANACGMSRSAFYYAAVSREQAADCVG